MVNQSQFIEMFGDLSTNSKNINITTIGELFDVGSSKRVFEKDWTTSGVPFYRAREIVKLAKDGFVDNELFITESMYSEYAEKYGIPAPGDIMVTGVGTLGVCYLVKEGDHFYYKDGNTLCFHSLGKIDSRFVVECYKMPFVINQIEGCADFTTVGTYTIEKARKTRIPWPSNEQQKKFLSVVYQADKSKFAGFKSQFIEETKRWSYRSTIGGLVDVNITKAGKKFKAESIIQYIDISSVDNATNTVLGATEYVYKDAPSRAQQCIKAGDILVSTVRPNLKNIAVNHLSDNNLVASSGFCVLRPKDGYTGLLLAYILSDEFTEKMTLVAKGTNYPAVHDSDILDYEITVPEKDEVKRIDSLYRQADKSKYLN